MADTTNAETIVVIAAGEMGAGIGRRLNERGARVLTSLKGRGSASAARAAAAGMQDVADDGALVAQADFILSVVPPGDAAALAQRLREPLKANPNKPVYVDCNAISPQTAATIGDILADTGAPYVDGGIIGGPPQGDYSPAIYVSGGEAGAVMKLNQYGLRIKAVEGGIGAASALKMSYAGITKGTTAIAVALVLGASRFGCADALKAELAESQPQLHARNTRQIPAAFPKAYRWVAEMEEIANFLGEGSPEAEIFQGMSRLYDHLCQGFAHSSQAGVAALAALLAFCGQPAPRKAG
jgi:3-hydroxyisobutyrate dehydrogenase-like beta-hydroxyacid dehydrogenase